jgi:hypothetical protein
MRMGRKGRMVLVGTVVAVLLVLAAGQGPVSEKIEQVFVTNFPDLWQVHGRVGIEGPVHLARSVALDEVLVTPVAPTRTTRLVEGGVIEVEGYAQIALSLAIEPKGELGRAGRIGAFLLPVEEVVDRAFREEGALLFPLEVAVEVQPGRPYVGSRQPSQPVAFGRYRVLYYNTTDKSAAVTLFAYLNNG